MLVERFTFKAKLQCVAKLAAFFKEGPREEGIKAQRVYSSHTGLRNGVALEMEFESFDERRKFWAAHDARPDLTARGQKFSELAENEIYSELWLLR